ncbi:hypothetical protein EBR78_02365 [bacterium]|nr:hypothetical protein [bacterium]NBX83510.1 hypothetical protein [bacterium]
MFGYKAVIIILGCVLALPATSAVQRRPSRPKAPQRSFYSISLGNWQEACRITSSAGPNYDLNSTTLGLGLGLGYVLPTDWASFVIRGQVIYGNSDIGFRPDQVAAVDFSGQNLSSVGVGLDFSWLIRLQEGVGIGLGIPLIGTFFLNKGLASGYTLNKTSTLSYGAFLALRLRRNRFVFTPKLGFLNTTRAFYSAMDFNIHF